VGSNAPNALHGKAFGERSEDFSAAVRRESNGIFAGCQTVSKKSRMKWRAAPSGTAWLRRMPSCR